MPRCAHAFLAGAVIIFAAGLAMAQADIIAARRDGLKSMGQHMEAMKAIADSRGDPRSQVQRIDAMIVFYQSLPTRFPPGTESGDTRALPAVWSDRPGFDRAAANMVAQLQVLRTAAANGDPTFADQFRQTGATCVACRRSYRQRI